MLKKLLKIFSVSTLGKVLGFIKIQLLTSFFGANIYTDALIIVINIYWFWSNEIIYSLFSNTLIPNLANENNQKGQSFQLIKVLASSNFLSLVFFLLIITFPKFVIYPFAPLASKDFFVTAEKLLFLLAPLAVLIPLTEIFTLANQFKDRFFISALNMSVWNLFQIISILISYFFLDISKLIYLYAFLTICAYSITTVLQMRSSNFLNYFSIKKVFLFSFKSFKQSVITNYSYFISTVLFQINIYINYAFVSKLATGSITIFDVILKVPSVFQSLLLSSLAIIFFNIISKQQTLVIDYYWKISKNMFIVMLPLLALISMYGTSILHLIYSEELFTNRKNVDLILYTGFVNIYFMGKIALLTKVAIVKNKGRILLQANLIATFLNFILVYFLIDKFELHGVILITLFVNIFLTEVLQILLLSTEYSFLRKVFLRDCMILIYSYLIFKSLN